MSFFERMIKLNQLTKKDNPLDVRESLYNEQEIAPNEQRMRTLVHQDPITKSKLSHASMKSKEGSEDQDWGDIFDQPLIKPVYKGPKPMLLHHLLPKKQQMMRDMLARKRQFQLKKMSLGAEKKGAQLQSKILMQSQKFKLNQSLRMNQLQKSKAQKMKSSSVKTYSGNKSKPFLNLKDSICSGTLQTQMVSSPVADNFNKEIMMKLLDIIEKDRNNHSAAQTVHGHSDKVNQAQSGRVARDQKESPIIINNIMRTPMESINRELIQREMKIKMLQNTRSQRQYSRQTDKKPFYENKQILQHNEPVVLTERNSNRPSPSGFKVISASAKKQSNKKEEQLLQQTEKLYQKTTNKENDSSIIKQIESQKIVQDESTKNNSNQNSRVMEQQQFNTQKQRKRQFSKRVSKKIDKQQANQFEQIQDLTLKPANVTKQHIPNIIKAPVKLQIPLENQSTQGLTLAEAFKKKIGRLKSQQKRSQKTTQQSVEKKSKLQSFPSQIISITDKMTQCNTEMPINSEHSSKVISICIEDLPSKRGMPSKNTSKQSSVKKQRQQSNKKLAQPSKELMDRLIYGERAKITKQEMYALTKKNYNNLPEVKAKKQEEEKRRLQQERINKAKEYQKAIRSGKSQLKN